MPLYPRTPGETFTVSAPVVLTSAMTPDPGPGSFPSLLFTSAVLASAVV